jgi:hypothetical protein
VPPDRLGASRPLPDGGGAGRAVRRPAVDVGPATASERFSDWVRGQGRWLGRRYAHELDRNWRAT